MPPMATARVDASAAPKTPHPNGKTKNQSSTTLTNAETTLHHMARRGAPSRRNDRTAGSDHQSEACEDHQQRNADVDGGDAVAADPMADKNAVGDRDGRDTEHTQQCGNEKFAEQAAYMFRPEVQCVLSINRNCCYSPADTKKAGQASWFYPVILSGLIATLR